MALSVEKTSKRGGRIVHEKDLILPPPPPPAFAMPSAETSATPPHQTAGEFGGEAAAKEEPQPHKPSITDLMKNPSKVVLCKVGRPIFVGCAFASVWLVAAAEHGGPWRDRKSVV